MRSRKHRVGETQSNTQSKRSRSCIERNGNVVDVAAQIHTARCRAKALRVAEREREP